MSALVSLELHHRITQFLYHEASLLDDWQFRDWLAQLDDDIRYTMRTTPRRATVAKACSRQPPGFLTTIKISLNAVLRDWKPGWPGQRSRRRVPGT